MTLWIVLTLMTVVAAVGLTIPLVRRYDSTRRVESATSVLGEQLRTVDSEGENLAPADVASLHADVGRRLISEAAGVASPPRPLTGRGLIALGVGLLATIGVAATVLYAKIGRPDLVGASATPAPQSGARAGDPSPHRGMDPSILVGQLETRMRQTPNDTDGWRMLGWSYMRTGRYADAASAYGRAMALDPANGEFLSAQGEALTQAAGGQVPSAAETDFHAAIVRGKDDPRARFYLALAKDQHGDHAAAMSDWNSLLSSAPPGAPWVSDVKGAIERISARRGDSTTGKVPDPASPNDSAPNAAAIRQAAPADQAAMIEGMVAGLDARLKATPRDPDGWVRLMRARMVLGDPAAASGAYRRAVAAYAGSTAQQTAFKTAAKELQIPGV